MKVKMFKSKKYITIGFIYLEDNKVILDFQDENERDYFSKIQYNGNTYIPDNGIDYMKALVNNFSHSYSIVIVREDRDKNWARK